MTIAEHHTPILRYLARYAHIDSIPVEDEQAMIELRNKVSSEIGRGLTGLLALLAVGMMVILTLGWAL